MILVTQIASALFALACIGHTLRADATKFDKILFCACAILFLLLSVGLQEVR